MNRKFFSNLNGAVLCYLARGSGRGIVLFTFEKTHQLCSQINLASIANSLMSNSDQLIQNGGANVS
jgi:hypothetical protein